MNESTVALLSADSRLAPLADAIETQRAALLATDVVAVQWASEALAALADPVELSRLSVADLRQLRARIATNRALLANGIEAADRFLRALLDTDAATAVSAGAPRAHLLAGVA